MPLHLGTYIIAPPQQLGGSVAAANARALASAARAEELQARWATPPPYAPDARPVRALLAPRRPRPAPVPALWVRLVQSMAVVGDGQIPGLGWTLQYHGDLMTAPLNSLGGPRRNAAKIHASAYPSPFSTTITAILVATINRAPYPPPTHGLVQE